ncbi:unnamed protein product [Meloidogyne enterolobii]|uniref:Uncharacterized protein n=1 Tax=Meloidogyne enterolobii TaxID=390850 RepID=A0ACB0Z5S6_MELEN
MEILDEHKKLIDHRPSEGQFMVAKEMKRLIGRTDLFEEEFLPKFVLSVGDNFYDEGISFDNAKIRFKKVFLFVFSNSWEYRLVILTNTRQHRKGGTIFGEAAPREEEGGGGGGLKFPEFRGRRPTLFHAHIFHFNIYF